MTPEEQAKDIAERIVRELAEAKIRAAGNGVTYTRGDAAALVAGILAPILAGRGRKKSAAKAAPKTVAEIDDEWLTSVQASEAMKGIDVRAELARARLWCETNRKPLSRRRLVNWLNHVERPLAIGAGSGITAPGIRPRFNVSVSRPEWREVMRRIWPALGFPQETLSELLLRTWDDLPLYVREAIHKAP